MIIENPIESKIAAILKYIKNVRQQQSISQYEMSSRLNISQNTYFKIESGKTKLDLYRLIQISNILEFDMSELFHEYFNPEAVSS
jgi:transcriptional regulator with XRE-family HTH domain